MRFSRFIKQLSASRTTLYSQESWRLSVREALLAEIRRSHVWQDAPAEVRDRAFFSQLFHTLFAQAILKPAVAFVLIFAVVSYSSVSTVQAARASLPGDALYSVKLGLEAAQVGVAFSESKKAELEISFATSRLLEVNQILKQDTTAESAPHIEQAMKRFSNDLHSVQKRLEKMGQEEKSEEKVLKISGLVNTATIQLAEDLLVIKEQLSEQKSAPQAPETGESGSSPKDMPPGSGAEPEPAGGADAVTLPAEAASSTQQALGTSTTTPAVAEEGVSPKDAQADSAAGRDLLATLDSALDAVDQANIKSLEVFVGKAQTSKSETVQQEAVDKIQKKIDKIEKNIDTAPVAPPAATTAASSTQPVLIKVPSAPSQVQEAIDEAKKILDTKDMGQLGQVVEKVKEAKAIAEGTEKQSKDTETTNPSTLGTSTPSAFNQKIEQENSNQGETSMEESFGS
ncbi:MAG: hypothetical protein HYT31_01015 [Parcubacteria group bacterium]|nr:hypothetical protein [Parcubacteria group bacterium]